MTAIDRQRSGPLVADGRGRRHNGADAAPIGELLRRFTDDASLLVRQELELARAEVRESAVRVRDMAVRMAIATALAVPGLLALTAFVILALGEAINSYWLSALIVGVILTGTAVLLARQGMRRVQDGVGLPRTTRSLRQDAQWGREELRNFKRELTA